MISVQTSQFVDYSYHVIKGEEKVAFVTNTNPKGHEIAMSVKRLNSDDARPWTHVGNPVDAYNLALSYAR